ncbi:MAG: hypothetical protein EOP35_01635 [Rubrivivax sp.]|nr:MAG: hypothetical protein EOP35_01635 [Rubrivivax sp.]
MQPGLSDIAFPVRCEAFRAPATTSWRASPGPISAYLGSFAAAVAFAIGFCAPANAGPITAGPAVASVPAALVDPLGSLAAGLGPDQFLIPIGATAGSLIGEWSFDLAFNEAVVAPFDAGGLFQYVYQGESANSQASLITSSGIWLASMIDDVSGYFDPVVDADGPLAYVLFKFNAGQAGMDPGIHVVTEPVNSVPTPTSLSLTVLSLALLFGGRLKAQGSGFHARPTSTSHRQ